MSATAITREEFERQFAARSGLSVAELSVLGLSVFPCPCGEDDCQGWQMVGKRFAADNLCPECGHHLFKHAGGVPCPPALTPPS
ncbi:MAG: hypothetical protein KGL39_10815 [Patescibacteria group bacterium]|nr:hypothetical protein [Patescibacteria group bacterium]